MKEAPFDAIIAGGGIVGAACADALSHAGLRVALVERDVIGSGATAAGMGHIVVMDDSPAQFALTRYSQQLWRGLATTLPTSAEYDECGTLWIAADEEEMDEALRKHSYFQERDVPSRILSARQLAQAEPNLRTDLEGALLVSEDAVVYSPAIALQLARQAQANGARLFIGQSVSSLGGGEVLLNDGTILRGPRIINATGAWSSQLDPSLPVKKRKGHLVITERYPGFTRHQLVELGYLKSAHSVSADSVAFNVQPRRTGQILIGSSRQYGNESSSVDQHILTSMLTRATSYMPDLAKLAAIRVWTGFRAATPDKLPLIGRSAGDRTLWHATGHEGLGITTSLATAALLAAEFACTEPAIPADPYLPSRYHDSSTLTTSQETLCNGQV